jgi:hypothetical protein
LELCLVSTFLVRAATVSGVGRETTLSGVQVSVVLPRDTWCFETI